MTTTPLLRRLVLGLAVLAAHAARADDDCEVPLPSWQPRSAVVALAQRNGWQVDRLKVDDGCYELVGRDAEGRRFKAKLNPASLKVIRFKQGRHEAGREREHGAPGSAASGPRPRSASQAPPGPARPDDRRGE